MQVALVHDYLNQMGGAEKVLLALHDLFPQAPIYTSIYAPDRVDQRFREMDIRTSFMQRLPLVKAHHQPFLPLFPLAFEQLDLRAYDLVISDSSAFAKGVVTRPEALHICYCHTPMRWAWNYEDYVERERLGALCRTGARPDYRLAAPVGLRDRGARGLFRGQLAECGGPHRQILPARVCLYPAASRHHALCDLARPGGVFSDRLASDPV